MWGILMRFRFIGYVKQVLPHENFIGVNDAFCCKGQGGGLSRCCQKAGQGEKSKNTYHREDDLRAPFPTSEESFSNKEECSSPFC